MTPIITTQLPMNEILVEYFSIFIFLLASIVLSFVLFALSYVIAFQKSDTEKVSAYECGFDPFDDARNAFDVRFYLVAILFIIFDLEVSFLFPWALTLGSLTQTMDLNVAQYNGSILLFNNDNVPFPSTDHFFAVWTMFVFLLILTVGFIYEWKKGALEWE